MGSKTTVGQVTLVGGSLYDRPGGILVDERATRLGKGRSRGNFYVLAEISGPETGRDVVAERLTQGMRDAYYGWRGSVTAGLQQAVRMANSLLFEENRNSLPGDRRTAGVSCLVLRDDDLFIAHAGPTAVYVVQDRQAKRYPEVSPWLDGVPAEEEDVVPLGQRRDINVALFHTQVGSGDTVLLADSELARELSPEAWPALLAQAPVQVLLDELVAAAQGMDLSALIVRLAGEEAQKLPAQPLVADVGQEVAQTLSPPLGERLGLWLSRLRLAERLRLAGQALVMALSGLWSALVTFLGYLIPSQVSTPQTSSKKTQAVRKTESKVPKRRKGREPTQSDAVQRILIWVAIAIPLIVAVVVVATLVQRGQSRKQETAALRQQANDRWAQAERTADPATVRTLLTEAQGFLDQFLDSQPEDPDALDLQSKIQARLDLINRVTRIDLVAPLNDYPAEADLTRVVVEGVHIFVMDRANGRVYHHRLDEQAERTLRSESLEEVLVSRGQQVGEVVVGDLVDMVWMPTGLERQKASLVILESSGALLDYDPATGELVSMRLLSSDSWLYPKLVGSHTGRFYLLDISANKIWRYSPTPDGYSAPPEEWLQADVDLVGAVDMAIGDSIYLLYADGTLKRLTIGEPDAFDIQDWDTPPRDPAALFTRPPDETKWIYVADRGNTRIVQCSQEGRFERQFQLADSQEAEYGDVLAHTTGLFVDEIGGNAYVLSDSRLYLLVLPTSG